jgi:hypothetical protein
MKAGIPTILLSVVMISASAVWANDVHHPEQAGQQPVAGDAAGADKAKVALHDPSASEKQFDQTRQRMKKMLAQMDKIHETRDPKERQRLMDEHMQMMRDTMQAMRGMGGPMMGTMEGKDRAVSSEKPESHTAGMSNAMRLDRLEKRLDMMQLMMEQMMDRQS